MYASLSNVFFEGGSGGIFLSTYYFLIYFLAHHPRNCLFYLRDKEPEILCKLLEVSNAYRVTYAGTCTHAVVPYLSKMAKYFTIFIWICAHFSVYFLQENAIPYLKENSGSPNDDRPTKRTCQVPIQKETNEGLRDDICGKDAPVGYATVCKYAWVTITKNITYAHDNNVHRFPVAIMSNIWGSSFGKINWIQPQF